MCVNIVNLRRMVGKPFVIGFCSLFWTWPCTTFNSIPIILKLLTNRNIALNYLVIICEQKTKDCARSGSFQHNLQHHCFQLWCLSGFLTSLLASYGVNNLFQFCVVSVHTIPNNFPVGTKAIQYGVNTAFGRFPCVRTDWPHHSRRNESLTFNENYPAISVKSYMESSLVRTTTTPLFQPSRPTLLPVITFWQEPKTSLNSIRSRISSQLENGTSMAINVTISVCARTLSPSSAPTEFHYF